MKYTWVFPKIGVPPISTPKWSFLVGEPHGFVGETHHFWKHPYTWRICMVNLFGTLPFRRLPLAAWAWHFPSCRNFRFFRRSSAADCVKVPREKMCRQTIDFFVDPGMNCSHKLPYIYRIFINMHFYQKNLPELSSQDLQKKWFLRWVSGRSSDILPSNFLGLKLEKNGCSCLLCLVVVSHTFLFSPRTLGKWSNLTHVFQIGWKPPTSLVVSRSFVGRNSRFFFDVFLMSHGNHDSHYGDIRDLCWFLDSPNPDHLEPSPFFV